MLEFWNTIVNFFSSNVWNIIKFFSILLGGIIVIFIVIRVIKRLTKAKNAEPVLTKFIIAVIRFVLWLVLILVLLSTIGFEITGLTTALSALVLAIGMALKDNISNLANGLVLVGSRKYKSGDYIVTSGVEGSIVDINFLFTTLKTPDGKQITLPNSALVTSAVTNFNAYDKRRVSYEIGVAYESDVELVKKVVLECISSCGLSHTDPAPGCKLKTLGESSIVFFVTFWVDSSDYWDAYFDVLDKIFNEFKRNNIQIPFNQVEMRERKDTVTMPYNKEPLPERVEKVRETKKKLTLKELEELSIKEITTYSSNQDTEKEENKEEVKVEEEPKDNNQNNEKPSNQTKQKNKEVKLEKV